MRTSNPLSKNTILALAAIALFAAPQAFAAYGECEGGEDGVCLVLPADAPEKTVLPKAESTGKQVSMVTAEMLAGSDVSIETQFVAEIEPQLDSTTSRTIALDEALLVQSRVRYVELHLQGLVTGKRPSLGVVEAGIKK